MKIISGGQTGVDRAALDAAMKHGFECGGWCPAGRLDEFGRIPDRYPLRELGDGNKEGRSPRRGGGPSLRAVGLSEPEAGPEADRPGDRSQRERDGFADRTLANVKDSDGTVVIYFGELRGGTKFTVQCCVEQKRPHKLIDAAELSVERAAELIAEFVREEKVTTLNVAGPRASEWQDGYDYTFRAMDIFFTP